MASKTQRGRSNTTQTGTATTNDGPRTITHISKLPAPVGLKKKTSKTKPVSPSQQPLGNLTRYSDEELEEFKVLIDQKLKTAREELKYLQGELACTGSQGDDSDARFRGIEDGTSTSEREHLSQMASRQIHFIGHLEKALIRIEQKTYGICRETGRLIPKERLRAVPHTSLSIEAKTGK